MAPVAAPSLPAVLHKIVPVVLTDRDGKKRAVPGSAMIVGVPGGIPDEPGIVLLQPPEGIPEREPYPLELAGQTYLRGWHKDRILQRTKRFPAGLEIGYIDYYTDTGIGQPFVEKSEPQISEDQLARLSAYAYGKPFLSMPERRAINAATEQFMTEQGAGVRREDTKTPAAALDDVSDERIARAVEKALAAERAKTAETKAEAKP